MSVRDTSSPLADLRSRPIVGQFLRYASVGVLNTAMFFALFNLLMFRGMAPPIAYAAAFAVASLNSYLLNKRWTFKDTAHRVVSQYLLFIFFTGIGVGLNEAVFLLLSIPLAEYGTLGHNLAALGAVPIGVLWNFTAYRRWTFTSRADRANAEPARSPEASAR